MWRPLSRLLELIGRFRIPALSFFRQELRVGHPSASDAQGGSLWRRYLEGERLYDVWGPLPDSPWAPFHCIPLFAALDRIKTENVGPTPPPGTVPPNGTKPPNGMKPLNGTKAPAQWELAVPEYARPGDYAPGWLLPDVMTIVDLPGPGAVEVGAWLVTGGACQPVCTFNNWPHPRGVLRPEFILAELLRWATVIADARHRLTPDSPPVWICDSNRLGTRKGSPGEFDNRYFMEDAILPGAGLLKSRGIKRIIYVTDAPAQAPVIDLDGFFFEMEAAGLHVEIVDLMDPELRPRHWIAKPPRKFISDHKRSAAGGFGTVVPEPSSGGGG